MKIQLWQHVVPEKDYREFFVISKEYNSNIVPHFGDLITDDFYKNPSEMKVSNVVFDYGRDICSVQIEDMVVPALLDPKLSWHGIAQSHGWKI